MASSKPSLPKGFRDFSPQDIARRQYIFNTIRTVFQKYGYAPIETPTLENLGTLTGKYGEEGDRLIFKVLNSGDFMEGLDAQAHTSKSITPKISEKALRYDLTVPFARYVVMHQNALTFPFKRYQIQPVWRADRPQRGRYREFYQCDADVVGSTSLIHEAEFIAIYEEALSTLGLKDFEILINNRKILAGIAEYIGQPELIIDMTVAIDKLDKIGIEGVEKELSERGFSAENLEKIRPFITLSGTNEAILAEIESKIGHIAIAALGITELREILSFYTHISHGIAKVKIDITLARGLNYYTGAIFEVKTNEVAMGSIGGGGRYDDLTAIFGLPNMSGVGISFGADRIFDVLAELNLFPENINNATQVLISNLSSEALGLAFKISKMLRANNISTELYHKTDKLQKQLKYANDKQIAYMVIIGEEELKNNTFTLKNMTSGEQNIVTEADLLSAIPNG